MKRFIPLLILVVAGWAPAPLPRKPIPQLSYPTPGKYWVTWAGSEDKEGELLTYDTGWYYYFKTKYYFVWEWDSQSRKFTMWESSAPNAEEMMLRRDKFMMGKYSFYLNDDLKTSEIASIKLHLKRRR